jgi:hypothetical protein
MAIIDMMGLLLGTPGGMKVLGSRRIPGNAKPPGSAKTPKTLGSNKTLSSNKALGSKKTLQVIQPPAGMLSVIRRRMAAEAVNTRKGGATARPNRISVVAHS